MTETPALQLVTDRKVVKAAFGGQPSNPTTWGRGATG